MSQRVGRRRVGLAAVIVVLALIVVALQLLDRRPTAAAGRTMAPAVASSSPAVPVATIQPTPSPRPSATRAPKPPFVDGAGFWISGDSRFHLVNGRYQTDDCIAGFCPNVVEAFAAAATDGIRVFTGGDTRVLIRGASIDAVRAAARKLWPKADIADSRIDGIAALRIVEPATDVPWAFAVVGSRLYGFNAPPLFDYGSSSNLEEFLWDLHFMAPGCWMTPCPDGGQPAPGEALLAFDAERTVATWTDRLRSMPNDVPTDGSMREFTWSCGGMCEGWLRVAIGTTMTGPLVAPGNPLGDRVPGKDVDDLRAAWKRAFPNSGFTPTRIGDEPAVFAREPVGAVTLLVIHRDYVIAISAYGSFAWDPAAERIIGQFLAGLTFLD